MTSTTAQAPADREPALAEVELLIGGMTCASCAARVEKKLNRMDGVTATVNYATEKARVSYPEGTEVADLIATVVKTGYTAEEPAPARGGETRRGGGPRAVGPAPAPRRLRRSRRARRPAGDGPGPPVRQLAVALAHPRRAGRRLGRTALPPGRLDERPARRRHHGHTRLVSARWPRSPGPCGRCSSATRACRGCGTPSSSRSRAATAPPRSTWRSPPASRPSSCWAATWRPAPSAARGPRSGP